MDKQDNLLEYYSEFQKRQKEIIADTKINRKILLSKDPKNSSGDKSEDDINKFKKLKEEITKRKNQLIKGKYLAEVIKSISHKYDESEIAIACGYYDVDFPSKNDLNLLISEYGDRAFEKIRLIPCLKEFHKEKEIAFKENDLESIDKYQIFIFKNKLCSWCHCGGTVFIPTRLAKKSKKKNYSQQKLKDWNFETLINDKAYIVFQDEGGAEELLEIYSFDEPMQYVYVTAFWYLNKNLETNEWSDPKDIADLHGLNEEDCHESSIWRDS